MLDTFFTTTDINRSMLRSENFVKTKHNINLITAKCGILLLPTPDHDKAFKLNLVTVTAGLGL